MMVVPALYQYKARLLPWVTRGLETLGLPGSSWHDGDTFNALVSRGGRDYWMVHVRCAGYDAPEMKTGQPATAALEYVRSLVDTDGIVYLDSVEFTDQEDSFGRMLAHVMLQDGRLLSTIMHEQGHAA